MSPVKTQSDPLKSYFNLKIPPLSFRIAFKLNPRRFQNISIQSLIHTKCSITKLEKGASVFIDSLPRLRRVFKNILGAPLIPTPLTEYCNSNRTRVITLLLTTANRNLFLRYLRNWAGKCMLRHSKLHHFRTSSCRCHPGKPRGRRVGRGSLRHQRR